MAQLGPIEIPFESWQEIDNTPFCARQRAIPQLEQYMDELRKSGDSVGARINVVASGVPVGWGEPVYDRLDADIAYAMMSINAVKGVEIGPDSPAWRSAAPSTATKMSPRISLEQRRRHAGWHLDRPGHPRQHGDQAHLQHPPRPSLHRQGGSAVIVNTHGRHDPAWHPRHADRRGNAGPGADRSCPAPSCPECRRSLRHRESPAWRPVVCRVFRPRGDEAAPALILVKRSAQGQRRVEANGRRELAPQRLRKAYEEGSLWFSNHIFTTNSPSTARRFHDLKLSNAHFARLSTSTMRWNKHVQRVETLAELATDAELEELKKQRLKLKDELYAILKSQETGD